MIVRFKQEKPTKNTIKFMELLDSDLDAPKIGTLYVQKATLKDIGWQNEKMILQIELKVSE